MREYGQATLIWMWAVVLMLIAMTMFAAWQWVAEPLMVQRDTNVIRNSNAYVTAHQQALVTQASEYERVRAQDPSSPQLDAIRSQMRQEAALITPQDVPPSARAILGSGGVR